VANRRHHRAGCAHWRGRRRTGGCLLLARIARRIHDLPPVINLEQLIGARGVSRGGLDPDGVVHVGGQLCPRACAAGVSRGASRSESLLDMG